ncbi:DNA modification system-associated small protein [Paenibacillus sp. FSL W7-1287]|uniref:DNA modification system-associated small protein n=1 Tax=Paenibacillus sp. FSL W7-1287 TaxID=2954538 RepID=UPI0030F8DEF4
MNDEARLLAKLCHQIGVPYELVDKLIKEMKEKASSNASEQERQTSFVELIDFYASKDN